MLEYNHLAKEGSYFLIVFRVIMAKPPLVQKFIMKEFFS